MSPGHAPWQQVVPGVINVHPTGRLVCCVCGVAFHLLGAHAGRTHALTADAYREAAGLPPGTRLTSPRYRAERSAAARHSPLTASGSPTSILRLTR